MPTPETATDLDARYGRTRSSTRRSRIVVISTAIAFVIVFVAWLIWGGLLGAPAQFEAKDTGHQSVGENAMQVDWQFTIEPGTPAQCAVQALNSTFGIVGWKIVDVPASTTRIRPLSETILTTEPAVTGLIYRCWLT